MARWFAMSTQFLTDPKVERMIDRHGNDAVAVTIALFSQAMLQEQGGSVERTYRTLAREANVDRDAAYAIVQTAAEVRFLVIDEGDDFEFKVTFPAWARHQANFRKAKSRAARKAHGEADVTDGHAKSQTVTKSHSQDKTGQEKTRQEKTEESPQRADAPLSHLLADLVAENDPNGKRPNVTKRWAEEEDRLIRLDARKPEEAERLIRWTQADSFWRGNVLSMPKFREKYGQLYQAAVEDSQKRNGRRGPAVPRPELSKYDQVTEEVAV
jgi:hypothetical protein